MKNRTYNQQDVVYLQDKDLLSETEIDENGFTVYCKWGKKRRFKIEEPPALIPFGRPKYKKIFLSFFLLFSGLFFLYNGYTQTTSLSSLKNTISLFILGILVFIPGLYHSFIVIRIWMGSYGYHYDQLGTD